MIKYKHFDNFTEEVENYGGVQRLYSFDNGYGASVIKHEGSYGFKQDLWELGVLAGSELTYDTEITNDVMGHLTEEKVDKLLERISKL